ncbi:hypothetical protein HHK36_000455 [Tetracentron sinense]|uniref:Uncharacterized protein n=1 Tax=Tetracentron sinense TaxID=13715 RepID=A0A834ZRY5_TETSI|nr:hypothetical protein HHK36_000455 [Tetracentron sinense]
MDDMACAQVPPVVRKEKKKQGKDELDRLKQAEKKKRCLEKGLTTSAAIISELEKKIQKKIEEQQRLNEEGAAIAEAVALCVLLGEDSDDSCKIVLKKDEGFNHLDRGSNIGLFVGEWRPALPIMAVQSIPLADQDRGRNTAEISAGLIAAQAVSSLKVAEDAHAQTRLSSMEC